MPPVRPVITLLLYLSLAAMPAMLASPAVLAAGPQRGIAATAPAPPAAPTAPAPRARDLGIPFEGTPGEHDAITDVAGVEVGHVTLLAGDAPLPSGQGPVRTGVTVVLPRGRANGASVYGGFFDLNGNGEMTGQAYLQDFGIVQGPIGISNTNAIGQVYAGIMQWTQQHSGTATTPVVAETWDGYLNDLAGFHVHPEHAAAAIEAARGGAVPEGNFGGGTGMQCFSFKGGIGTASRRVRSGAHDYTVGVLVQCNTGDRATLRIAGVPVGAELGSRWLPCYVPGAASGAAEPKCRADAHGGVAPRDQGSIIIVVATDAPLLPPQLNRLARRAALGLARLGSYSGNSSGDLVVSFSTAGVANEVDEVRRATLEPVPNPELDPLFRGTVEATEEAIVNALVAAHTMTGLNGYRIYGLPIAAVQEILARYARLAGADRSRPAR